jgi:hypothetical protein
MPSYPLIAFPTLPGIGWPVKRTPRAGSTRSVSTVSGRVARLSLWANPLFDFELTFDGLASNAAWPGLGANSKQALEGFFLQMQGSYAPFVFVDITDTHQTSQALGVGDGTTTTFTVSRSISGSYSGPVDYVLNVATVYSNGTPVAGGSWNLVYPNHIVFTSAPGLSAVLTIDFFFGYLVTFADDTNDFDQFMSNLWAAQAIKLRGVRAQ